MVTDESEFKGQMEQHRRALRLHAYRMLGSFDDAEDMVQETFLRAWRGRETYAGRASLRAWLYGITTNACIDFLRKHESDRKPTASGELLWLQPFPDRLLERPAPRPSSQTRLWPASRTSAWRSWPPSSCCRPSSGRR